MNAPGGDTLWSGGLDAFRDATASPEPTPGGGSVASVSATLGLGLVIMALEISARRKDAARPEETKALIEKARRLLDQLSADADDDVHAFRAYMAALKLPKVTDDEKERRRQALQAASRRATETPLLAARHIVEALSLANAAEPLAHPHVVSDVGAGAALLEGALKAVLFNVDVNLPSIADAATKAAFAAERAALATEGATRASETLARITASFASRV